MEDKIFIDGEEYRYIELKNKKRYVNKNGILIDAQTMKLCKTRLKEGYLYSGNIALHLFVAHAWVDGYFEGAEVNHKDFDGLSELTVGLRDFERIANLQLKLWDGGKVRVGAYSFSKLWKR